MALFDGDIDILRQFIPGLTRSFTADDLMPELEATEAALLPAFFGEAIAEQIAGFMPIDPADLTRHQSRAFHLARVAVGRIAFANYLPFAEVQIGDDGVTVTAVDGRKAAFEYQTNKLERRLRDEGWRAIDELITLVAAQTDTFPDWPESPYYAEHQKALFKTPAEFSKFYPIQDRWLTFWALRPFIRAVEENAGETAQERIDRIAGSDLPDNVTQSQLDRLKRTLLRALAYQSVIEAVPNLSVELAGANVQVNYASQFGNATYFQPPANDHLTWVLANLQKQADLAWSTFENDLLKLNPTTEATDYGTGDPYSTGAITLL